MSFVEKVSMKKITLCICTYKGHDYLIETLKSILTQSISTDFYDVLILDNTPNPCGTAYNNCKAFAKEQINFKYIEETSDGLSGARNACLKRCKTNIIHFLDDDVLVSKNLVKNVISAFEIKKDLCVLGGKITPNWSKKHKPDWLTNDLYGFLSCINYGDKQIVLTKTNTAIWLAGANLAFKTSVLKEFGGFSVSVGRKGNTNSLLGSEESLVINNMRKQKKHIIYHPNCSVQHIIRPERIQKSWFIKRCAWQVVSDLMINQDYMKNIGPWSDNMNQLEFVKQNIDSLLNNTDMDKTLKVVKMLTFLLLHKFDN